MLTRRTRSSRFPTRAGAVSGASRHLLSLSGLGVFLAIFAQGLTSCGSDGDDQACEPGALKACQLAGETCAAVQTCSADGSAYGACACPGSTGNAGSAGAAGSSGNGGSSNGGAAGASGDVDPLFELGFRAVGAPCETDADCPVGPNGEAPMVCIPSNSTEEFGGGPQGGFCSVVCSDDSNNGECLAVDGLSACGLIDPGTGLGFCIGLCQPGNAPNAVKCNADRAQACFPFEETIGACFPVCQSDAACGEGLFCDFGAAGLGTCTPTAPTGGEIGDPCVPVPADQPQTDCKSGVCVTMLDPDTGEDAGSFCSANCTNGLIAGCGFALTEPAGTRDAVCLLPQVQGGGPGDLGFCFELCDVDADCAQADAGWVCVQDLGPAGQAATGRLGECLPPAFAEGDGGVVIDAGN